MALILNPYVNLRDTAREALEFYRSVLGGDLRITTFGDFPEMAPPGEEHLVMHGQLTTDDGLTIMVSDTPSTMAYGTPAGYSVSISGEDGEKLQRFWDGLSEGGTITAPYMSPPWGGTFGMFTDRFGVDWMISHNPEPPTIES